MVSLSERCQSSHESVKSTVAQILKLSSLQRNFHLWLGQIAVHFALPNRAHQIFSRRWSECRLNLYQMRSVSPLFELGLWRRHVTEEFRNLLKKNSTCVTLFFDVGGHSSEKLLGNCALFSGNLVTNARRLRFCEASKSGSASV